jgi:hypothetical protein
VKWFAFSAVLLVLAAPGPLRAEDEAGRLREHFREVERELLARSGRRDLVDKVAATRNNAYIPELANDPELVAWLEASGLSLEEAARIQPSYRDGAVDVSTARSGAVMLGVEGATIAWCTGVLAGIRPLTVRNTAGHPEYTPRSILPGARSHHP